MRLAFPMVSGSVFNPDGLLAFALEGWGSRLSILFPLIGSHLLWLAAEESGPEPLPEPPPAGPENDPAHWIHEHGPKLLAFARQWVPSHADAEDVFQEAFIRFWQSRHRAREPLTYLYQCIRNAAINWLRSRQRRDRREQEAIELTAIHAPEMGLIFTERQQQIDRALAKLPEDQRRVVVLKVWSEMTFGQIADVLSIPRSTAHAWYRSAMTQLQAELEGDLHV